MNSRTLAKRKSETDILNDYPQHNSKRLLTERIAAGMGVLRLTDPAQDAQGNTRPPFVRTTSTPSTFYNGPSFIPARPDLVSSFELPPAQTQSMDEDLDMACEVSPSLAPAQQICTSHAANSIYSQPPHLLNSAPWSIIPVSECKTIHPLYPIIEEDEHDETPILKMTIPKLPEPSLEIPFLHNLANPESRALILYTPPKAVIEESLERNKAISQKDQTRADKVSGEGTISNANASPDQGDVMMLD